MGIEQTNFHNTAESVHNQPFNIAAADLIGQSQATHKFKEQSLQASNGETKSILAGFQDAVKDGLVLDLTVPVLSAQKKLPVDKPAADVEPPEAAGQFNKYQAAVAEQVGYLDSEAKFTQYTRAALGRDADKYPPVRNEKDQTTTYTLEQTGLTDRGLPEDKNKAEYYKRLVTITVPNGATSLKDCQFAYQDRQKIDESEFLSLVDREQKRQIDQTGAKEGGDKLLRPDDMVLYTHGIRTSAESADFQALALQLTQGHSVIDVDWKSTPPSQEKVSLSDAYQSERKAATKAYSKMEKPLDGVINHIGAEHADMIAFSHGAMFDTKYMLHRKSDHAPLLHEVILTHPDVPLTALPQPGKNGKIEASNRLYATVSKNTHVIGSGQDLALSGAAYNDSESNAGDSWIAQALEKSSRMSLHERIGSGTKISRDLVDGHGGTYVMETIPKDKKDPYYHFINYAGINNLINDLHPLALVASSDPNTGKVSVTDPARP